MKKKGVITQARLWLSGKVSWWKCGFHGDRAYLVLTVHPPCLSLIPTFQTPLMLLPILHLSAGVMSSCPRAVIACIDLYYPFCCLFSLWHYNSYYGGSWFIPVIPSFLCKVAAVIDFVIIGLLQYSVYSTSLRHGNGIQRHAVLCVFTTMRSTLRYTALLSLYIAFRFHTASDWG